MADKCEKHGEFEIRLGNVEKKIDEIDTQVDAIDTRVDTLERSTALDNQRFTLVLENLSKLPQAMDDIKDALVLMKGEIKSAGEQTTRLEQKVDKLDRKVCSIDDESKLNLREWIKQNFIPLAIAVSGIIAWASTLV